MDVGETVIIGNGDIASVLKDRDDRIYFASGVSNSGEVRDSEFNREIQLLTNYYDKSYLVQDKFLKLVYFSSLCVFYLDTPYAKHKRNMENLVRQYCKKYTIIRIGNIKWGDNPYTIINFLKNKIKNNEPFEIQNTHRYVVGKEEFLHWIDLIPEWNCEINIPGEILTISEIVRRIKLCQL